MIDKARLDFENKYKQYLFDEDNEPLIWFNQDTGDYVNHRVFWDSSVGFVNGLWVEFKDNYDAQQDS